MNQNTSRGATRAVSVRTRALRGLMLGGSALVGVAAPGLAQAQNTTPVVAQITNEAELNAAITAANNAGAEYSAKLAAAVTPAATPVQLTGNLNLDLAGYSLSGADLGVLVSSTGILSLTTGGGTLGGAGIAIQGNDGTLFINNTGGTIAANGTAVRAGRTSDLTIVNSGLITGGIEGSGIRTQITNTATGEISTTTNPAIANLGENSQLVLRNSGRITSAGPIEAVGAVGAARVQNEAGATISSGNYYAMQLGFTVDSQSEQTSGSDLVNSGTIRSANGQGVRFSGKGTATLNAGSITGSLDFDNGGAVTLESGNAEGLAAAQVGPINFGDDFFGGLSLRGDGVGTLDLSTVSGANLLTRAGAGTWTLTGAAASPAMAIYTGESIRTLERAAAPIGGGTLVFAGSGLTGNIYLDGGTIRATAAGAFGTGTIFARDPRIEYAATGTYANDISLAISDTQGDPTTLAADSGVTATLSGTVAEDSGVNPQPLVIDGAGTIVLTNEANSWRGTTTINAGATLVGTGQTISGSDIVNNGALVYDIAEGTTSGVNQGISGTGTLTKTGAGTLTLGLENGSGEGTTPVFDYTGATTIAAGTLAITDPNALARSSSVTLSGATAVLDLATVPINLELPFDSTIAVNNLSGVAGTQVRFGAKGLQANNDTDSVFAGTLVSVPTDIFGFESTGRFIKTGDATLTLTGSSTIGDVAVEGGTLTVAAANTINNVSVENAARLNLTGAGSLNDSFVQLGGESLFDVSGVTGGQTAIRTLRGDEATGVTLGATTLTLTAANDRYNGVISGTGGLTIAAGNQFLGGINTYTGATVIAEGATLNLGANQEPARLAVAAVSPEDGSISQSSNVQVDGTLSLDQMRGDAVIRSLSGAATGRVLLGRATQYNPETNQDDVGPRTLFITNAAGTFAGVISDQVQIDYNGETEQPILGNAGSGVTITGGTQVFTNTNTYTGTTTLDGGNLTLGDGGTTGSVAGPIALTNGTLTINRSNAVAIDQVLSGAGNLVQAGTGTTTLSGANTYSGATTIAAGRLALTGAGSIAASSGLTNNGTFDISALSAGTSVNSLSGSGATVLGANTLTIANGGTYAGIASGTGGITIAAGNQVFTGNNSYTGATTLNGGNLTLGNGGTTGAVAGPIALGAGTLTINRSNAVTLPGVISGTGNLVQAGTGTTTLSAVNTYTGTTTIAAGTLSLTNVSALSTSSAVALTGNTAVLRLDGLGSRATINNLSGVAGSQVQLGSKGLSVNQTMAATFAGTLAEENAFFGGFNKTGAATLTLTGVNDLDNVQVRQGTLALAGGGSLNGAQVSLQNGALDVSAVTGGTTSIGGLIGNGGVTLGATTLRLTNADGAFSGVIAGSGGLALDGGTQEVTGAQTYTGATSIAADTTLYLTGQGAIAASSGVLVDGTLSVEGLEGDATIRSLSGAATGEVLLGNINSDSEDSEGNVTRPRTLFITNANGTFAGVISDRVQTGNDAETEEPIFGSAGSGVTLTGGTQVFTGANTYTGTTTLAGGNLTLGDGGTTGSVMGPIALTNGTLTINRSNAVAIDQVLSGAGNLVQAGTGTTTLSGANTYTGTTAVNAGTLAVTSNTGLASSSAVSVAAPGALSFNTGARASIRNLSGAGTVRVTGAGGLDIIQTTDTVFSGNLASGGVIGIDKSGTGRLTLTGVNTVTSGVGINAGTLALAGNGSLAAAMGLYLNQAGANFDIAGITADATTLNQLQGAAGSTVTLGTKTLRVGSGNYAGNISGIGGLTATGPLRLSGTNSFSGPLAIDAGTLTVAGGSAVGDTTAVTVAAGATFALANSETIGSLSGSGATVLGANRLTLTTGGTYAGAASGTGGITIASGNQVFTGNNSYTGTTTLAGGNLTLGNGGTTGSVAGPIALGAGTLTINRSNAVTLPGVISGTGNLVQAGTGTTTLTAANTYTGATTISAGTLALTGAGSIAASSGLTNNGTFDIAGLGAGTSVNSLSGNGATLLGANTLTIANGGSYAGVASGTGGLTLTGGTATLSGANTYTGATTVSGGTLTLAGGAALADAGAVTVATGATLVLATSERIGSLSGAGTVALGANTLSTGGNNASTSFGGAITGTGGLTKEGTGSFTLTGTPTYTGTTTIAAGTLVLGSGVRLASDTVALTAAGTVLDATATTGLTLFDLSGVAGSRVATAGPVTLGSANSATFAGVLTGTGGLTKVGTGTQTLSGANTLTGPVAVNAGTLAVAGGAAIADASVVTVAQGATFGVSGAETVANLAGAGSVLLNTGATLTFGGDNAATSFGGFSGAGALVKTGTGVFSLARNGTATGLTSVNGGTLRLAGGNLSGPVAVASGASLTGAGNVGALSVAAGGTLSPGNAAGEFATINAASLTTAGTIRIDFGGSTLGNLSDRIVVAGAINVTGGTIDARPASATNTYSFNQYFALTAGTTFTGRFDNPTDFTPNAYDPRLRQRIRYDLGAAAVLEVRFLQDLTLGLSSDVNARGVGVALNGTQSGASDSFSTLINALADQTGAARQVSLNQLSGEGAVSGREISLTSTFAFLRLLGGHTQGGSAAGGTGTGAYLTALREPSRLGQMVSALGAQADTAAPDASDGPAVRGWAQGYSINQAIGAGAGGLARIETDGLGAAAGLDISVGGGVVGVAVGYSAPKTRVPARLSRTNGDSYSAGIYGRFATGPFFATGALAYGRTDLDNRRSVVAGPLSFASRGQNDAETYGASFTLGASAGMNGAKLEPVLSLDYVHDNQDAYTETGAGAATLRFAEIEADRLIGRAELRASKAFDIATVTVVPQIRGGAAKAWGDRGLIGLASFTGAPSGTGAFAVRGARLPEAWGTAGASLSVTGRDTPLSMAVTYDGAFAKRLHDHRASISVGLRF